MKQKAKLKNKNKGTLSRKSSISKHSKQPFIEHAYELRRRIYCIVASVLVTGSLIYSIQQKVVNTLLKPSHSQHFIYTSPGGGIDFLFKVCVYTGLIISTPIIVYNVLGFMAPLMTSASKRFLITISLISGTLAIIGVIFGYFIGLPAALHFLLHQFTTVQIQPLVTIQSYLNFVMAYFLGSALLFQLPIALICINRIKPLKPSGLIHHERWVILAAFILSGLMNPTPNIISQLLVAGPFIIMYQFGIVVIAVINRPKHSPEFYELIEKDIIAKAQRQILAYNASYFEEDEPLQKIINKQKLQNENELSELKSPDLKHLKPRRINVIRNSDPVHRPNKSYMDLMPNN